MPIRNQCKFIDNVVSKTEMTIEGLKHLTQYYCYFGVYNLYPVWPDYQKEIWKMDPYTTIGPTYDNDDDWAEKLVLSLIVIIAL